jgi:hypothetical protein
MRYDSDVRHNDKAFDGTEERGAQVDEENVDRDLPEGHDGTATHVPVDEPRDGIDEPHAGVDEPHAGPDEPRDGVGEPRAAVDEATRPGSVDDRATEPVAADPLMASQFSADRSAPDQEADQETTRADGQGPTAQESTDRETTRADGRGPTAQESTDRETTRADGQGPTARDTGDPVAPALGETTPAEAGQTTSTESISTDAAIAGPALTDASASEASTDASGSEASTDASGSEAGTSTPETPTDLKPGEAKVLVIKELWSEGAVDGFRERWHQVQVSFLDDPQDAATQAEALLDDVLEGLHTALADRKSDLDSWSSAEHHDTEEMRVTVRGYRDLLDRLLTF